MRLGIDRKAFESALGIGGMFAGKNRVQAVLGLVKITIRNDRIRMTSFTGEVGISTSVPINTETESDAVFCMEPALLLSAVKLIESDTVMLSADDDMKSLMIEYGGGEMTMGIYPATDFPEFGMDGEYMPLDTGTFDKDALIIDNSQVDKVTLCRQDKSPWLSLSFKAPVVGLWSPPGKDAPFVCIEPWYGRCDRTGYAGDIKDRDWMNVLAPGAIFESCYTIRPEVR